MLRLALTNLVLLLRQRLQIAKPCFAISDRSVHTEKHSISERCILFWVGGGSECLCILITEMLFWSVCGIHLWTFDPGVTLQNGFSSLFSLCWLLVRCVMSCFIFHEILLHVWHITNTPRRPVMSSPEYLVFNYCRCVCVYVCVLL